MKARTIEDTEAKAIAAGVQTLLAGSWGTDHRGPVLIVGVEHIRETFREPHAGTARCVAEVTGWREMLPGDARAAGVAYAEHRIVWELGAVRAIEPGMRIENCGRLMYEVPNELLNGERPESAGRALVGETAGGGTRAGVAAGRFGMPDGKPAGKKARPAAAAEAPGLFG